MKCLKTSIVVFNIASLLLSGSCSLQKDTYIKKQSDIVYVEWLERQYAAFHLIKGHYTIYIPDGRLPASDIIYWQKNAIKAIESDFNVPESKKKVIVDEWKIIQLEAIDCMDRFLGNEIKHKAFTAHELLTSQDEKVYLLYQRTKNKAFKPALL